MKNFYSKQLLAVLLLLCSITTNAHDFAVDGIYYNIINGSSVEVTFKGNNAISVNEYSGNITIPEKVVYNGTTYSVTSIGNYAFYNCEGLTSITIGTGVTSIGNYAFSYCEGLTSITIPNSVTSIGNYAFNNCEGLTSITIGTGVTSIGDDAFSYCRGLTSITIGTGVTSIGNYAFKNCKVLKSVTIPNSVTSIGESAFNGCSSLSEINIEDGLETLLFFTTYYSSTYTHAFKNCPLKKIYIGREIDYITNSNYYYNIPPFKGLNIDTLIISKKPLSSLGFENINKQVTLLYIDNNYSKVIPVSNGATKLPENCTLHYFNAPLKDSEYKDITDYFKNGLNCKSQMVPLGNISAGFYSLEVTLNDTLIQPYNRRPSISNNSYIQYMAVNINSRYIAPDTAEVYKAESLKLNTDYPVRLTYNYNGKTYTTSATISTKRIELISNVASTLSTATIRYEIGDTIGLGQAISEIGIYYNGINYPAEGKDESTELSYYTTIKDLYPRNSYSYQIYCKTDTTYHYSDRQTFSTKSPTITLLKNKYTQTTASLRVIGEYSDDNISPIEIGVMLGNKRYIADKDGNVLITGLKPDNTYIMTPYIKYSEYYTLTGNEKEITTAGITIECNSVASSATTITIEGMHDAGDATVIEYGFNDYGSGINKTTQTGLAPNSTYTFTYFVTTEEGGTINKTITATTDALTFKTLPAKATSNTRAVICAEANIANEEAGVGFEWRRIDAPDLVPSNYAACAVNDSTIEGVLNNLSANTYYKYRPYYCSAAGKYYYGEWIGFGTADAYVYFTPTVHTYEATVTASNAARLYGYALAGSDDVIEQGFEYWADGPVTRSSGDVMTVTGSGQRMNVLLENLEYGTVYKYRTYVKTANETVYGEIKMFETSYPVGIEDVTAADEVSISVHSGTIIVNGLNENDSIRVYTLQGELVYNGHDYEIAVESGIYIVKVGDTAKKVLVK